MEKKLFVPLIDNGLGMVQADFMYAFLGAFSGFPNVVVRRISDSHPGRGRNRAAVEFLETDCTHLLFIDTDIIFTREHLELLAESDDPVIGGVYCLKTEDLKLCLQTLPGFQPTPAGGLIEVARTGTGFLRIARDVFEKMKNTTAPEYYTHGRPEWDFFRSGVVLKDWLSEDWYFCEDARSLGYKVKIDTRIQLQHQGRINYPLKKTPDRLELCPKEMKPHIEQIWQGEYAIDLDEPPKTVLDVGANIGGFSVWALEQWPDSSITAFEPHPENATIYKKNTKGWRKSITFMNWALVGTEEQTVALIEGENCGEHRTVTADFTALPELFISAWDARQLLPSDFVKLDCEGREFEILKVLNISTTKAIALEYHTASDRDGIRELLKDQFSEVGYRQITDQRGILKFKRKTQ